MELFSFDRSTSHSVDAFGSSFQLAQIASLDGHARVACFHMDAGDAVGRHEAVGNQFFCVVAGEGWVSGDEGEKVPLAVGQGVLWRRGEQHAAGTDTGMTAVVIEGSQGELQARPQR